MSTQSWLQNHFLIAMPSMEDPNFSRTVTYICEHNDDGAMGIVVNRPTDLELKDVLQQMDIPCEDHNAKHDKIYLGGPVQTERGFVLHQPFTKWDSSIEVVDGIGLATSMDILTAIGAGTGPQQALIVLGYAGWTAGQLESELAHNSWLSGPADLEIVFNLPHEERWDAAAASLGVDMSLMSIDPGHA